MAATANKLCPCGAKTALRRQAPLAGAFSVFMAFASTAHAVDWRFQPTLNASAIYTDNVNQSASNTKDALILSATPGFTLKSTGSRQVKATLQYGLTGVKRFGGDQSDNFYHNLNAAGNAELVEDFLYIDGNARVSQELISLLGSPADASVNDSNRATVGTYSISPYIRKRLGTFANAQARYTNSGAIFENDVASNAKVNSFSAGLNSGTQFNDLSWALNYSIRKAQNRNAVDTTFERANAMVGYALTRKFRVFGTAGQDWNDYLSASGTSGSSYSAGFGWSPTRRTSVEASAGERYFGRTYSLSGSHRTRLSSWTVRYAEDVSDVSRLALNFNDLRAAQLKSCPAGTVLPPHPTLSDALDAGCNVDLFFGTSITTGVFISKLLTAGTSWDLSARTNLSVTLSDLTRVYQLANQGEDRVRSLNGVIRYRLSPRTTASSGLSFVRNSLHGTVAGGVPREDDIISLSLGLNHRFTDKFNGTLTLRHTQRDSNVASSDYDENRIMATANLRF
jgi:uncharacterized protein (PEP-CTERM system associated)